MRERKSLAREHSHLWRVPYLLRLPSDGEPEFDGQGTDREELGTGLPETDFKFHHGFACRVESPALHECKRQTQIFTRRKKLGESL